MSARGPIFDVGFSADKPSIAEVDSLQSRQAVLAGMRKGTEQRAIGQIRQGLDRVMPLADIAAMKVVEPIEEGLTQAAQARMRAYMTAGNAIRNGLDAVREIAKPYLPVPPKRRRGRTPRMPAEVALPDHPSTREVAPTSSPAAAPATAPLADPAGLCHQPGEGEVQSGASAQPPSEPPTEPSSNAPGATAQEPATEPGRPFAEFVGLPLPNVPVEGAKKCKELSIASLSLYYPGFVLAERAAAKTDYDVLYDAAALGLCEGDAGEKPECSVPYLERVMPHFVLAAKAQGKTDVEMLRDAVAIGLCRAPDNLEELGTTKVEEIAPGSAEELEAEFDPPANPDAPIQIEAVNTDATAKCPAASFVMPDYSGSPILQPIPGTECLAGLDRAAYGAALTVANLLRQTCACPDDSAIAALFDAAKKAREEWGLSGKIFGSVMSFLGQALRTIACNVQVADNYVQALTGCGAGETAPVAVLGILAGVWERWVGALPSWAKKALDAGVIMTCPTNTPTYHEGNSLFATNFISKENWECLVRKDGFRIDFAKRQVEQSRSRPSDDQLLILQRKLQTAAANVIAGTPQIGDPPSDQIAPMLEEVGKLFGHNGWTNQKWFTTFVAASQWVPAPTDAVEWMLKDVQDPQIQETFKLDAEFGQKYSGHVRDVFQWNGISDNDALQIWKAHWRNMAPHVLYEMHKRLRPGWTALMSEAEVMELVGAIAPLNPGTLTPESMAQRPESNGFPIPTYLEELSEPETARLWLESLATTAYHVSEGLGQDDYPPFWRARLLALSYRVLGRIDLRRAYEIDAISFERLVAGLQDQGFSPGDSALNAQFMRKNAIQLFSRKPASNQWVNTGFDIELLQNTLVSQGMREDMFPDVLKILRLRRQVKIQQECMVAVRKRFLSYQIDDNTAFAELTNLKLPLARVNDVLAEWRCLRASKSKQEAAAQICLYFRTGIVTGAQAVVLLKQLGYNTAQARRMLSLCYIRKLPKTIDTGKLPEAIQAIGGIG